MDVNFCCAKIQAHLSAALTLASSICANIYMKHPCCLDINGGKDATFSGFASLFGRPVAKDSAGLKRLTPYLSSCWEKMSNIIWISDKKTNTQLSSNKSQELCSAGLCVCFQHETKVCTENGLTDLLSLKFNLGKIGVVIFQKVDV